MINLLSIVSFYVALGSLPTIGPALAQDYLAENKPVKVFGTALQTGKPSSTDGFVVDERHVVLSSSTRELLRKQMHALVRVKSLISQGLDEDAYQYLRAFAQSNPGVFPDDSDVFAETELLTGRYAQALDVMSKRLDTGTIKDTNGYLELSAALAGCNQMYKGQASYFRTEIAKRIGATSPSGSESSRSILVDSLFAIGYQYEPEFLVAALKIDPSNHRISRALFEQYVELSRYSKARSLAAKIMSQDMEGDESTYYTEKLKLIKDLPDRPKQSSSSSRA